MKHINLLPKEYKELALKSKIQKGIAIVVILPILFCGFMYLGNVLLLRKIEKTNDAIAEGQSLISRIQTKKENLDYGLAFLSDLDNKLFPFNDFIRYVVASTPSDLYIISVDTLDRSAIAPNTEDVQANNLQNGETVENANDNTNTNNANSNNTNNVSQTNEQTSQSQQNSQSNETNPTTQSSESNFEINNISIDSLKAEKMEDMKIVIRGSSANIKSVSDFIYRMSLLSYVENINLTAIERLQTPMGEENVFEISLEIF